MDNEFGKKMKEICLESFIASLKISEKFIESSLRILPQYWGKMRRKKKETKRETETKSTIT